MHSKNVDSRLGGYDTMLNGSYQQEFTTSSLGLMDPEDRGSKAPPKHPPPQLLTYTASHPNTLYIFNSNTENFMSRINKRWEEHYRTYTTDIRWKLFIASEATPSLDLNIIHSTAHMKGAGIAKSAYQLGYRLKVQGSNSRRGKRFFSTTSRPALGPTQPPI